MEHTCMRPIKFSSQPPYKGAIQLEVVGKELHMLPVKQFI